MRTRRGSVMHATDRPCQPTVGRPAAPSPPSVTRRPPGPPSAGVGACLPPSLYPYPVASGTPPVARRGPIYTPRTRPRRPTHLFPSFPIPVPTDRQTRNSPTRISLGELRRRSARPLAPSLARHGGSQGCGDQGWNYRSCFSVSRSSGSRTR
uniref:Uncharacterized protein n=1 Tax=Triticum urartu TaxID=4572 RepID=A0A8R7Q8I0_TRIUA